ncbi:hypothetical protein AK812_SmicGene11399 [Symbiodinium microadriaticum]|uniref:Uncharacterized protein n=1 Tax=Symbiodinium microadriaticum TaxID=2951 RepID=A0A1Q9EDE9_SYMMI|nr:hypothetical protein AK812_SmicGene11399 [Symbiodinium microadriaticum]
MDNGIISYKGACWLSALALLFFNTPVRKAPPSLCELGPSMTFGYACFSRQRIHHVVEPFEPTLNSEAEVSVAVGCGWQPPCARGPAVEETAQKTLTMASSILVRKVKNQTPKAASGGWVAKAEKKKKLTGRAKKRFVYNRRFVSEQVDEDEVVLEGEPLELRLVDEYWASREFDPFVVPIMVALSAAFWSPIFYHRVKLSVSAAGVRRGANLQLKLFWERMVASSMKHSQQFVTGKHAQLHLDLTHGGWNTSTVAFVAMLGPGAAKFPPFAPLPGMGFMPPGAGTMPAPTAPGMMMPPRPGMPPALPVGMPSAVPVPMNGVPPAQVGPGPDNTPKPQDVLLLIRQGVANQDKAAVKTALQYATQMGTPIEAPILDMLRQWLGEDTFSSVMAKSPPTPTVVPAKAGAPVSAPEPVVKAKAAVAVPAQPPLVVIREGVAKQDKGLVRAALRMAVEQGTQIDKPVLDMLRKWLSEEDESLNILAARAGMPIPEAKASQEALAVSTVKAAAPAPVLVAARPPAPTAAAATAAAPLPPGIVQPREAAPVVTEAAPALREQTPKISATQIGL